jgi:hypothetical protein
MASSPTFTSHGPSAVVWGLGRVGVSLAASAACTLALVGQTPPFAHLSLAQLGPTTVGASNHLARLLFREHPVHFTSLPLLLACILSSCFGTLLPACLPTPRLTPRLTRDSTTWKSAFANTAELSAQVSLLRQLIPPPLISTPHAHAAFSPAAGPSHHVRLRRARA